LGRRCFALRRPAIPLAASACSTAAAARVTPPSGIRRVRAFAASSGGAPAPAAGFRYSNAMADAGMVWNEETLDALLAAPGKAIPGTAKSREVADAQDRADIIAYLKTLTEP
jgi:hypothetical protein